MLIQYIDNEGEVAYIGSTGIPKLIKLKNIWLINRMIIYGLDEIGFRVRIKNWFYIRSMKEVIK